MARGQNLNCSKADLNKQSGFRGAPVRPLLSKFMFTVKTGYTLMERLELITLRWQTWPQVNLTALCHWWMSFINLAIEGIIFPKKVLLLLGLTVPTATVFFLTLIKLFDGMRCVTVASFTMIPFSQWSRATIDLYVTEREMCWFLAPPVTH